MKIIVQKHDKHWRIVHHGNVQIYKKEKLILLFESSSYVVWSEFLDLIVSNVPESDNLIQVVQDFYKDEIEVLPF